MRFELIDRVLERTSDGLVAVKCVTTAEEYLADHFPGFPVLPGVIMLEVLTQAGRAFLAADPRGDGKSEPGPFVLSEARNVRYSSMIRPGQSLRVQVTLRKHDQDEWEFDGVGTVDDRTAVQGRIRLAPLDAYD